MDSCDGGVLPFRGLAASAGPLSLFIKHLLLPFDTLDFYRFQGTGRRFQREETNMAPCLLTYSSLSLLISNG